RRADCAAVASAVCRDAAVGTAGGHLRLRRDRRAASAVDHARSRAATDRGARHEQRLVRCGLFWIELLDGPPEGGPHRRSRPDPGWHSAATASGLDPRWGAAFTGTRGGNTLCGGDAS